MSAGTLTSSPRVQKVLQDCRRQIIRNTLLNGLATLLISVVACVLVATSLDFLFGIHSSVRAAMLVGAVAAAGWVAWRSLISPLSASIPNTELGAAIDLTVPDLNESLATLISLSGPDVTPAEAGSSLMRSHIEEQVAEQLQTLNPSEFVDGKRTLRQCGTAAGLVLAALLPVIFWPSGSRLLLQRLVQPFANLESAGNLYFEVPDGDRTVARRTDVQIAAAPRWRTEAPGERPQEVELHLIAQNGETERLTMSFDELSDRYVAGILNINDTLQYRIVGGGTETRLFTIKVVDAPEIQTAVMTVVPPAYSGRGIARFDGMVGEMEVFERSELQILLEFNKPVASASLLWLRRDQRPVSETQLFDRQFDNITGEEIFELDPELMDPDAPLTEPAPPLETRIEAVLTSDQTGATLTMSADVGGDFVFEVIDQHGLTNAAEPDRTLVVAWDTPPELKVAGLRDGDRFRPDDIVPVNSLVTDDIGVGVLELHYRINDTVTTIRPAESFDQGAREVQHSFRVKLAELQVVSADQVTFQVRAADERPEPGPQEVWSREFTVHIDENAAPAGARALDEETQAMVDALKQLEQELTDDTDKARSLRDEARTQWTDQARSETERLSEKEQQQGRVLEQIAAEVGTHPLMQESAAQLGELAADLRQDIPEQLEAAADQDRAGAEQQLDAVAQQLEQTRRQLHDEIERIEERARLEQDLAELNRLALEAEQLAEDARQLDDDRHSEENKPEELSQDEWDRRLDEREQALSHQRDDLSADLSDLLQQEPELLKSAQQSQREQLAALSETVADLAEQQERVAAGVSEEAVEAGREAVEVVEQLQKVRKEAEKLNRDLEEAEIQADRPDLTKIDEAIQELRRGNLAEPQQNVEDTAAAFENTKEHLSEAAKDKPSTPAKNDTSPDSEPASSDPAAAEQRARTAQRSGDIAEQLSNISEQIEQLQQTRQGVPPQPSNPASEDSTTDSTPPDSAAAEPAEQNAGPRPQDSAVQDLLSRLKSLAAAADQMAENLKAEPGTAPAAQQSADQAAADAAQGQDEAAAGRFARSAEELREAAANTDRGAAQMNGADQADQREQMQGLRDDLNRTADTLQNMQQDNAAQAAAQQQTQQKVAERASMLPDELSELAERLNMPALQMPQQAQQAGAAQQAAAGAQQETQQANSALQQGQLQQAGQSGETATAQLQRLARIAGQAGQQPADSESPVPSEVGESVVSALQDLQQAARAMQPPSQPQSESASEAAGDSGQGESAQSESGQPATANESGQGQPGESGQPSPEGEPGGQPAGQPNGAPSGSQQLSEAAQALAEAARNALPEQFNPSQMSDGADSSAAGRDAMGNASLWDGRIPNSADGPAGSRNWGRLIDELDSETSDRISVSRDSEYESLIRMYFREVAKATSPEAGR